MAHRKSTSHQTNIKKLFPMLVIGGARSGKSSFALQLGEPNFHHPLYIATAEACDAEMKKRIAIHKQERSKKWRTVEEPIDIVNAIKNSPSDTDLILIECITLWITNCLFKEGEKQFFNRLNLFIDLLKTIKIPIIMVSNEVGMGIVPENKLARKFRDIAGFSNQQLASVSSTVIFTIAGQPLLLKYNRKTYLDKILDKSIKLLFQSF